MAFSISVAATAGDPACCNSATQVKTHSLLHDISLTMLIKDFAVSNAFLGKTY